MQQHPTFADMADAPFDQLQMISLLLPAGDLEARLQGSSDETLVQLMKHRQQLPRLYGAYSIAYLYQVFGQRFANIKLDHFPMLDRKEVKEYTDYDTIHPLECCGYYLPKGMMLELDIDEACTMKLAPLYAVEAVYRQNPGLQGSVLQQWVQLRKKIIQTEAQYGNLEKAAHLFIEGDGLSSWTQESIELHAFMLIRSHLMQQKTSFLQLMPDFLASPGNSIETILQRLHPEDLTAESATHILRSMFIAQVYNNPAPVSLYRVFPPLLAKALPFLQTQVHLEDYKTSRQFIAGLARGFPPSEANQLTTTFLAMIETSRVSVA